MKCWRCEACSGFILWSGYKTCGNLSGCSKSAQTAPSWIQRYEERQEHIEEAIISGHYVLYDQNPALDQVRPIFDDDVLPPLPPPPLPPLTQLPPQQLLPLSLPPLAAPAAATTPAAAGPAAATHADAAAPAAAARAAAALAAAAAAAVAGRLAARVC
jgi:hypothetical protein